MSALVLLAPGGKANKRTAEYCIDFISGSLLITTFGWLGITKACGHRQHRL